MNTSKHRQNQTTFIRTLALIAFFISALPESGFCQENFQPGYITTLTGDTLHGMIDYRDWEKNPVEIHFREQNESRVILYAPGKIRGFGLGTVRYESATVKFEQGKDKTADYPLITDYREVTPTVFLQVLVDGPKKLYHLLDEDGHDQFFIGGENGPVWLMMKKYLKTVNGERVLVASKNYIGQLTLYLQDSPGITKKLNAAAYQEKSLTGIFRAYYGEKNVTEDYRVKTKKAGVHFGPLLGLTLTKIKFSGSGWEYLSSADFPLSPGPSLGCFLNAVFPKNLGRWSSYNELLFTTFTTKSTGTYRDGYIGTATYSTTLGFSYLKLVNMIRFSSPVGKEFIFINAGITNGIMIAQKNSLEKSSIHTSNKALDDVRRYEFGFTGGVGFTLHRFSVEARYERSNGMSAYTSLSSPTHRFYLLFGFRF